MQVNDNLRRSLDSLQEGDTLGVLIDKKSRLHLLINGEDLGPIAQAIPARRFAVLDLYGCCEEVSIVTADHGERGRVCMEETKAERGSGKVLSFILQTKVSKLGLSSSKKLAKSCLRLPFCKVFTKNTRKQRELKVNNSLLPIHTSKM